MNTFFSKFKKQYALDKDLIQQPSNSYISPSSTPTKSPVGDFVPSELVVFAEPLQSPKSLNTSQEDTKTDKSDKIDKRSIMRDIKHKKSSGIVDQSVNSLKKLSDVIGVEVLESLLESDDITKERKEEIETQLAELKLTRESSRGQSPSTVRRGSKDSRNSYMSSTEI
jgi:hypothetical protein